MEITDQPGCDRKHGRRQRCNVPRPSRGELAETSRTVRTVSGRLSPVGAFTCWLVLAVEAAVTTAAIVSTSWFLNVCDPHKGECDGAIAILLPYFLTQVLLLRLSVICLTRLISDVWRRRAR